MEEISNFVFSTLLLTTLHECHSWTPVPSPPTVALDPQRPRKRKRRGGGGGAFCFLFNFYHRPYIGENLSLRGKGGASVCGKNIVYVKVRRKSAIPLRDGGGGKKIREILVFSSSKKKEKKYSNQVRDAKCYAEDVVF